MYGSKYVTYLNFFVCNFDENIQITKCPRKKQHVTKNGNLILKLKITF
jgi:hypothetical protein